MDRGPVPPFAKPWKLVEIGESFQVQDAAGKSGGLPGSGLALAGALSLGWSGVRAKKSQLN